MKKMRKKVVAILMCGTMVFSLAACGSSSTAEKDEAAEETVNESSENEEGEAEEEEGEVEESGAIEWETTGLVACFEYLAQNIAVMTYDEAVEYMESTDFSFDTVKPSYDELGTITSEDDEDGCHIWLAVYRNNSGEYTIYDVSYGNGQYEGSVSDNTHTTAPVYETYNKYAEEPRTKVESLDSVISYIVNDIPELIEEDNEREPGEPIEVTMDASVETTDEGTVFTVETNLPDGTMLSLKIDGDIENGRLDTETVEDGKAVSVAFTENGVPLKGNLELTVNTILASSQPSEVQNVIGKDGENLAGEYLSQFSTGEPQISATFSFTIE